MQQSALAAAESALSLRNETVDFGTELAFSKHFNYLTLGKIKKHVWTSYSGAQLDNF